jgi:hypothetical protein
MFSLKPEFASFAGARTGENRKSANAMQLLWLVAEDLQVIDLISIIVTASSDFSCFLSTGRKKTHGAG